MCSSDLSLIDAAGPHAVKNVDMTKAMLAGFAVNAQKDSGRNVVNHSYFGRQNYMKATPFDGETARRALGGAIEEEFKWVISK